MIIIIFILIVLVALGVVCYGSGVGEEQEAKSVGSEEEVIEVVEIETAHEENKIENCNLESVISADTVYTKSTISVTEAVEQTGLSRGRIYTLINAGLIKAYKEGRLWKIERDSLYRFIRARPVPYIS